MNKKGQITDSIENHNLDNLVINALEQNISLEQFENTMVRIAVERCEGNLCAAARLLGISRAQIGYKYKKIST
ncbi:helix-turn-helix domain-containing protein [Acinetobacter baumannii]